MNLQQQFESAVNSPLTSLSPKDLEPIALGLWYEDYTPKIKGMNSTQLRRTGYLLDLLMSFNCVSDTRQAELIKLTQEIRQNLSNFQSIVPIETPQNNLDPIAIEWHLGESVVNVMQSLLEFQTRHYAHNRTIART